MSKSKKRPDTALYFNEVTAIGKNQAYFGGHLYDNVTNVRFTRIRGYENGIWKKKGDIAGIVKGMVTFYNPDRRVVVLSDTTGLIREYIPAGERDTAVEENIPIRNFGSLMSLKKIGSTLYACGTNHQVFKRTKLGWIEHDQGISFVDPQNPLKVDRIFCDIDGTSENNIYCVGMGGALAHYDGHKWSILQSPSNNQTLFRVLCVSDHEVYIAGNGGALFKGNHQGWKFIGLSDKEQSFCGLTQFQGKIYASTLNNLWMLENDSLVQVKTGIKKKQNFYRLAATETDLWATSGTGDIYHYDGDKWECLICPDNI
jgi:hypothetical protein